MKIDAEKDKRLKEKLLKAKIKLLLEQPFFGTLTTQLTTKFDDTQPTACTDGKSIWWNTDFLDSLSPDETRAVLAHEVMHVAYGHVWRRGSRDMEGWNIACDKAINPIIKKAGLPLPSWVLWPETSEEGKAAEDIYRPTPPNNKKQSDPGRCGGVSDAPGEEAERNDQQQEWKVIVSQAAAAARSVGKLPAEIERMVQELLNPRVHWETVLRDFVEHSARNDYNWTVPNRRHLQRGIVLPSLVSEELPEIVIAIDTSGSIGQKELDQFASEVSSVLGAYHTTIHIVFCDAAVNNVQVVTRADLPFSLEPKGGGGTDFRPVFNWVTEQGMTPAAVIYLTDMYGTFPDSPPEYPVLWVTISEKQEAPFGQVLQMN